MCVCLFEQIFRILIISVTLNILQFNKHLNIWQQWYKRRLAFFIEDLLKVLETKITFDLLWIVHICDSLINKNKKHVLFDAHCFSKFQMLLSRFAISQSSTNLITLQWHLFLSVFNNCSNHPSISWLIIKNKNEWNSMELVSIIACHIVNNQSLAANELRLNCFY